MADFLAFTEGVNLIANTGFPATCYFLLSTRSVDSTTPHAVADTLAGGVGEITGTGYARQSQAEPSAASRAKAFTIESWSTGAATDWPNNVRSCVLVSTADNSGVAICAWNLQAGGGARDMSLADVTENVTPTFTVS
jgi:hypothetical protein